MREEDEIQFNRHANEWRMAKTATKKVRPKQPQHMAKTATDCGQNGHRKDVKAVTVSDIQVPKESLKKKETPVSPENGDCLPPNSTKATEQIIAFLNEATGKRFKPKNTATQRLIRARLSDGFTVEDFNKVIVVKSEQWKGNTEMERYLRPQTLFSNKFEGYLQESNTNTSTQSAYGFGDGDTGIRGYGL
ncbi:MAG: hypothetical protein HOB70_00700 [Chloroflexi bacterium]|nr:hypothetical protein [Chloroflexota bacterium]